MPSPSDRVERLTSTHAKAELKDLLREELGASYPSPVPGRLNNDFLRACFQQIAPDEDVDTRLRQHDDYSPAWAQKGTKHNYATAIRMVLTDRVGRAKHDSITSLSKPVLAELVVACRLADSSDDTEPAPASDKANAPDIPTQPPSPFDESLDIGAATGGSLTEWLDEHRSDSDGPHAVYVLDCTPTSDADENSRLKSLRASVGATRKPPASRTPVKRAGAAVNRGERVYYVGYTADVEHRLQQHRRGAAAASARFTNLFEPQSLVEVSWFDTESGAKAFEQRRATELTVEGESYAYYN